MRERYIIGKGSILKKMVFKKLQVECALQRWSLNVRGALGSEGGCV